jgi:hypothetical protein
VSELAIEWLGDQPVLVEAGTPVAQLSIEWLDDDAVPVVLEPGDPDVLEFDGAPLLIVGTGGHATYTQPSDSPAATWTWIHNLNSRPPITTFLDSDPEEPVITDVFYPDLNTVVIEWPSPESGKAYI